VARPLPPPPPVTDPTNAPPRPPERVMEPIPVPPEPVPEDTVGSKSLDDLNRDSPLKPVFFELDSAELSTVSQGTLQENANVLKKYSTWQITIEGHCDERGSAEYNLALGERRALVARDYLVSLGVNAPRVKTVSYGKEFPFDPGHDEGAWVKNRRAHFVITAK
jgi:peptidoglycan-associated lipoprotein